MNDVTALHVSDVGQHQNETVIAEPIRGTVYWGTQNDRITWRPASNERVA
jgi:hypothetical protein